MLDSLIAEMKTIDQYPFRFLNTTRIKLCYYYFDTVKFEYVLDLKGIIHIYLPFLPLHPRNLDRSTELKFYSRTIPKCNLLIFFVDSLNLQRELDQLKLFDSFPSWDKNIPLVIFAFYNLEQEYKTNILHLKESFLKVNYNHFKIIECLPYHDTGFVEELFSSIKSSIPLIPQEQLLKLHEELEIKQEETKKIAEILYAKMEELKHCKIWERGKKKKEISDLLKYGVRKEHS